MSKSSVRTAATKSAKTCFAYRNIKKDFNVPGSYETVTKQFHLELGDKGEVVKVEDRPTDWVEFSNKDINNVGLANILELARRRGEDPRKLYAFKDEEAIDISGIDSMDPSSINQTIASGKAANQKLESIAKQLGVSVDVLVDSLIKGTLTDLISSKIGSTDNTEETKKDGEK